MHCIFVITVAKIFEGELLELYFLEFLTFSTNSVSLNF